MIWLIVSVALGLVLAILEIDPIVLASISFSDEAMVSSERWRYASHLFLSLSLLCILLVNLVKTLSFFKLVIPAIIKPSFWSFSLPSFLQWQDFKPNSSQLINKTSSQTSTSVAPLKAIYRVCYKTLLITLLLLALLTNTMAHRISVIERSPTKITYVNAEVTPIGLSDRRLVLSSDDKFGVDQGYRQLVKLTNLSLFDQITNVKTDGSTTLNSNTSTNVPSNQLSNPFLTKSATDSNFDNKTKLPFLDDQLHSLNREANNSNNKNEQFEDGFNTNFNDGLNSTDSGIGSKNNFPDSLTVMLTTYEGQYEKLNRLAVNESIKMTLVLNPLDMPTNSFHPKSSTDKLQDFNEYRWLSSRHAVAKAKPLDINFDDFSSLEPTFRQWIDIKRFNFRDHFLNYNENFKDHTVDDTFYDYEQAKAVTLSLLTGDRSLISTELTSLYRYAGISHLLAISGTHVLFFAILCSGIFTAFLSTFMPFIFRTIPRWQCSFVIAVISAFAYALFAGFDIPAIRTAFMLLIIGVLRLLLSVTSVFKVLLGMALTMVWFDVFVLWQAGFWLSFIAVAVLIIYSKRWESNQDEPHTPSELSSLAKTDESKTLKHNLTPKIFNALYKLFKLQMWMSIALLPLSLWLFGKVSLWGFLINLFAIGLFGWIIVPLNLLAGVLYSVSSYTVPLANEIWLLVIWILDTFHHTINQLQIYFKQSGWLYTQISLPMLMLIVLAALPYLLPKGVINRIFSGAPLLLIAAMVFDSNADKQDYILISKIEPKLSNHDTSFSLSLIRQNQEAWVLISAYKKGYDKSSTTKVTITEADAKLITQAIYDKVKIERLNDLTGVIVQTATPELAKVVVNLREVIPISYYWQAGLSANNFEVAKQLKESNISAESCVEGKQWQSLDGKNNISMHSKNNNNESININSYQQQSFMTLSAVTGWDTINDSAMWDCTIKLTSSLPIKLTQKNSSNSDIINLSDINHRPDTLAHSNIKSFNNKYTEIDDGKEIVKPHHVIFYTSDAEPLSKLWRLMCSLDSNLQQQHFLSTTQAFVDTDLINVLKPNTWFFLNEKNNPLPSRLTNTYLYWEQAFK